MRRLGALLALAVVACSAQPTRTTSAPSSTSDLVVSTSVPNGMVEVVVKRSYPIGRPVRATVRLQAASGTLRGPLAPIVQASGFHATGTVRHLDVIPVTASGGSSVAVDVVWDAQSDEGVSILDDDYSLVFEVEDDRGRRTTIGATLVLRGA